MSSVELPICLLSLAATFFVTADLFQGRSLACLACFSRSWISSVELPICLLSIAAIYLGEGAFVSGPVTGLLGRPAAFFAVGFFHWASSLLAVSSCLFFL